MADSWYEFSDMNHFWIQRRFAVMNEMLHSAGLAKPNLTKWLDVGCGAGLLQQYCALKYQLKIDGADLNLVALAQNPSGYQRTFCYNILERKSNLSAAYDIVSILDVLEHISDEDQFLEALLFHIKPNGYLLVNVPAIQRFFSKYDKVAGHVRRYDRADISQICAKHRMEVVEWSYWGISLLPVLLMRNLIVSHVPDDQVIKKGFSANNFVSLILRFFSRLEMLPNHVLGTSLMFILKKLPER